MADEPDPGEKFIKGLTDFFEAVNKETKRQKEIKEQADMVESVTRNLEGVSIGVELDRSMVPFEYVHYLDGLLMEQSKASLFIAQLSDGHGYTDVLKALGKLWSDAAGRGAIQISKFLAQKHGHEQHDCGDPDCPAQGAGEVGPDEFNAAWISIIQAAVLGAIRYGQAHPEAFTGMEGVKEGEIDQTIVDLVKWVEDQTEDEKEE